MTFLASGKEIMVGNDKLVSTSDDLLISAKYLFRIITKTERIFSQLAHIEMISLC